jgi:Domain of Unknown Function (DUF1080)
MKLRAKILLTIAVVGALAVGAALWALNGHSPLPSATEQWEPVPRFVEPIETNGSSPPGALILFDGTNLAEWINTYDRGPAGWTLADGVVTVHKPVGNIETRRAFRNYRLHIEWRVPAGITGEGQSRGNSGLFLASTGPGDTGYELQVLDPWRNPTYVNGMAGAIYKQHVPLVNPGRPPGEWNVYDVVWTAPVFAADGKLTTPARATVHFNGVLVQDNVALAGPTLYIGKPAYKPHGPTPIKLQAHNDPSAPISFRNIWLVEMP